jgi:Xaa-Pro aminopeptidase
MANNRKMQAGEIVLMDTGADYDYYTADITRTWPVSGRFTPEQEKQYGCILEARDAVIAAMKPGITVTRMQEIAAGVYAKHGFGPQYEALGRYIGHYVGISVHDVGPDLNPNMPFEAGVVFNVEPILEFRNRKLHYRLEDTILITKEGRENLTAAAPADLQGLYALLSP